MRCKGCDYPLWDIAARACPECGLPFRPSEYEFAINSVRFCCHRCGQAYYGTGASGHLVPSRFHCVSCAQLIDMDEMLVLPRDGVPENISLPERMPWLERRRIGFWRAFGGTWIRAIGGPSRLADAIPKRAPDGSGGPTIVPALLYAMILVIPYMTLGAGIFMVFPVIGLFAGFGGPATGALVAIASTILTVVISCVVLFALWAAIAHMALRVTGPAPAGLPGTVAALGYSSGAAFLAAVPCLSVFLLPVGMCWWAIVATLMAIRIQRASPLRSVFAFLVAPLLTVCVLAGGGGFLAYALGYQGTTFTGTFPPPPVPAPLPAPIVIAAAPRSQADLADRVAAASLAYLDREGSWPRTGLDLVRGNDLSAAHLIYTGTPSGSTVGGMTLDQIDLLLPDQMRLLADAFASESDHPSGISRSAQVIFFSRGVLIVPEDADASETQANAQDLWLACALPPEHDTPGMAVPLIAVHVDGSVSTHPRDQETIDDQNRLRRALNLPELPSLDEWP